MQICIHPGKRYLMWEDGTPFYPVADTAWTLPQRLTEEEVTLYADCRKAQGFNTVLICAHSELDGLRIPNRYGELPFEECDPLRPVEAYWERLDRFLSLFWERDMVIGLLPTWGDKFHRQFGEGPEIFTPENAYTYGQWLAERYKGQEHLFWVLGGDRPLETDLHRQIVLGMGQGLRSRDTKHRITFHPSGAKSSVDFLPNENLLDFHSLQSGHGLECWDSAVMLKKTREAEAKPCWDMECRYEQFPVCFDETTGELWDAADVRWNVYQNMMAGGFGQSYGHRRIWRFDNAVEEHGVQWIAALQEECANQQRYAADLRCRGDFFAFAPAPELIYKNQSGPNVQSAAQNDRFAFFYTPFGEPIYADLSKFSATALKGAWFDPRTGEESQPFPLSAKKQTVTPPSCGRGNDWVLIVDRNPKQ